MLIEYNNSNMARLLKFLRSTPTLYHLLLFVIAILAYWQVALLLHPLKYDLIDQAYPWKYLIGEMLQAHILPLWNPYQLLGSPIHADPQGSAWYPMVWIIGYLFGYNIYTISIDFILHIFLAGSGMFYLARSLKLSNSTAFIMAVSYMLSGFFVGNAQHFMWIIGATWIPFVIGSFIRLRDRLKMREAFKFSLFMFLMMTGSYPALIIIMSYLLLLLLIYYITGMLMEKAYQQLQRFILLSGAAFLMTLAVSAVVLVSLYHLQPAITRSTGVGLEEALFSPFSPQSFISFLLPFAVIRDPVFYQTDLSMSNGFFGMIMLIFFIVGLGLKKPRIIILFLVVGVIALLVSVGDYLPVREFLYRHMFLMDMFRFPSVFRLFVIISFIIVAGYSLEASLKGNLRKNLFFWAATGLVGLVLMTLVVYNGIRSIDGLVDLLQEPSTAFSASTIGQHIFVHGLIQLAFLVLLVLHVYFVKERTRLLSGIMVLMMMEMVVAVQLNGPFTVYAHKYHSSDIKKHSEQFPAGFPIPEDKDVIYNRQMHGLNYQVLWKNLNIFHKQISAEGYNPLKLNGFVDLLVGNPGLYTATLHNRPVFLSDRVFSVDQEFFPGTAVLSDSITQKGRQVIRKDTLKREWNSKDLIFDAADYNEITAFDLENTPDDRVQITAFSPVRVDAGVSSDHPVVLTLLQNNYPGWKAEVDGAATRIYTSNYTLMSVVVPRGSHQVSLIYRPGDVIAGYYISLVSLLLIVAGLVLSGNRKRRRP